MSAASWVGFFAPAGTPEAVLAKLNSEINALLQEAEIAKRIEASGLQTTVRSRADSAKLLTDRGHELVEDGAGGRRSQAMTERVASWRC